ncbi:hypothetical protein SAMN02745225_01919 [Ferrithrix thermotolerans DSM 19514]|uniref:Uncharacterized protein n=1 Tax=Ferrithrix thermotolerans DSM 19514 TaxID=1121881 RepID=A0A1M4X7T9_9ACTN|nr:hypothetical protein [Ferrithrix thermotolerans]SHE89202.1 hypothetical protein SAMN02745225_01919 [Ferrithrix thermotolerans DSM 19514]
MVKRLGSDLHHFDEPAKPVAVDSGSPVHEQLSDLSGHKDRMGQVDLIHIGHHFEVVARLLVVRLLVIARAGSLKESACG